MRLFRNTIKYISKQIAETRRAFTDVEKIEGLNIHYKDRIILTASGKDIDLDKKSDFLTAVLYTTEDDQYLVLNIQTKYLYLIPMKYDEYIIKFNRIQYASKAFTIEDALSELHEAKKIYFIGILSPVKPKCADFATGNPEMITDRFYVDIGDYKMLRYND